MIQRHFSNYIKDGYAHYPQVEPSHNTIMTGDRGPVPAIQSRINDLEDSDGPSAPHSPIASLAVPPTPAAAAAPDAAPATPFNPKYKMKGRPRKDAINLGAKYIKDRVQKEIRMLEGVADGERKTILIKNIKADINHLSEQTGKNYTDLLPVEYH